MTTGSPMQKPLTRRSLLDWLVVLGSGVVSAALAIPAIVYLWPAAKGGANEAVEVEGAKDMALGQAKTIQVAGKAVIVLRDRSGFKAFSAVCTHLGCLVTWDLASKHFLCPCHAAAFAEDGSVVSGPPPAPLPSYKVKEVGDKVFVSAA